MEKVRTLDTIIEDLHVKRSNYYMPLVGRLIVGLDNLIKDIKETNRCNSYEMYDYRDYQMYRDLTTYSNISGEYKSFLDDLLSDLKAVSDKAKRLPDKQPIEESKLPVEELPIEELPHHQPTYEQLVNEVEDLKWHVRENYEELSKIKEEISKIKQIEKDIDRLYMLVSRK